MGTIVANPTAASSVLIGQRTGLMKLMRSQFSPRRISLFKPRNMGLMAELAADRFGRSVPIYLDQPFLWDPEQRLELDYVQLATLIGEMSGVIAAAGVRRRDRVVILKTPNYDVQSLAWAAARIGAVPALLSARLDPDILQILLGRIQPKLIITDPAVAEHAGLDAARLRELGCTAIADIDGGTPLADLWGAPVPAPTPVRDDEPMIITHTSSTTGVSKLGEGSAATVTFSAWCEGTFPLGHGQQELFASCISHVHIRGAITQMAAMSRGTPVLGIANPDDATILKLFPRYRPTIVEAHPNAFMGWERLVDDPSQPFASLRLYFNTFDAIHPRTIRRLLDASQRSYPLWVQCYGMTETLGATWRLYTRRSARRPVNRNSRSVGWPLPRVHFRIGDPATGERQARQGEPGMIQVKTPGRVLGFVGTPEKFEARRHGQWFDTGDWGRRGRWGQVEVFDRVADRIDGVESCLRIEDVLLDRIPDAEEIVVVPGEHGQAVAVVCMREGKTLDPAAWQAASAGLTGLGEPFLVTPDELHRTATVKARRYLLTELITANRKRDAMRREVILREGA